MRMLAIAAVLAILGSAAVAQSDPPKGNDGPSGSGTLKKRTKILQRRCIRGRVGMKLVPTESQPK